MQRCHTYKIAVSNIFKETTGGGGSGSGGGGGGQDGCEQRIKVFVKIQKNILLFFGGVSGREGGSDRGGRVGVRVDVNEELKFLGKFTKKNRGVGRFGGGGVGSGGGGEGGEGLGGQGGCE